MTIEEFNKITDFFPNVTLCGQRSDPVMNNNLPQFIEIANTKEFTYKSTPLFRIDQRGGLEIASITLEKDAGFLV